MQPLILASGSRYRAELLQRLNRPFEIITPSIDERRMGHEPAAALCQRLAQEKARAARNKWLANSGKPLTTNNQAIIIASDQVAALGDDVLGKPGSASAACVQLQQMQGQHIAFYTALSLIKVTGDDHFDAMDTTIVHMRALDDQTIARYVEIEQPLDCAGSFKMEGLGVSLFESVKTEDPTALIGLPMIALCKGLRTLGFSLP